MKEDSELIVVNSEEEGQRLDRILAGRFQGHYSRTYFQYLIDSDLVLVNGVSLKKRMKLKEGDEIELQFATSPEIRLSPENIPLSIIYEDEFLLAVNKPAGMVVHPAPGHWSGTFVNALLFYCQSLSQEGDSLRPGIVHRLDKETSGVLIAAKTLEMQQKLIEQFASRKVFKEYIAICVGRPPDGEIRAPIGRHPVLRKQMAIVPSGREAISICKSIQWNEKLSVVQVVITTGRTHQIRVHLQSKGHPVLGDSLYGNPSVNRHYKIERQLLHAAVVRFVHPVTGQEIELKAPLPEDMMQVIRTLS